eukprot:g1613.t1
MALTEPPEAAAGAPSQVTKSKNSLYVGDLDKEVDETILHEVFSKIGPVASIRICRDSVTRRSLGYGYVNYVTSLDVHAAEKAIELLSYTRLKGKPIRVMWADKNPQTRKRGIGNIFIKGLSPEIDSRTLHDTFEVFGVISSAKVARDEGGASLGYGYVQYESPQAAQSAIDRANGMLLEGRQLTVVPYTMKSAREVVHEYTNIYIKHLPPSVDSDEALTLLFSKFGEVTSCCLPQEEEGGKAKGFGFVNFKDSDSARRAVEEMNDLEVDGSKLYVTPAQRKSERKKLLEEKFEQQRREQQINTKGRNLYIKHLAPSIDNTKLIELFEKFGHITSAKIMYDENHNSKAFGFVCFSTVEEAAGALAEMNNKVIDGQSLYVALAQPKSLRQAQLEQDRLSRMTMTGPMYSTMMSPHLWSNGGGGGVSMNNRGQRPQVRARAPGYYRTVGPGNRGGYQSSMEYRLLPNSASIVDSTSTEQQKILLGEQLYPLVHSINSIKAAKITGMLLEMDNEEILYLIERPEALQDKVEEALGVLKDHEVLQS